MEKISDEELFYLRSRGIAKQDSLNMILEAKIVDLFGNLDNIDTEFYKELKENILTQI
jgi:Fe-S cluster assembly scaffold protein SufB